MTIAAQRPHRSPSVLVPFLGTLSLLLVALLALTGQHPVAAQSGAPGTVTTASPASGATNQNPTLSLAWLQPSGAVPGTTAYTVNLWDPNAPPTGHYLGALASTTSLSKSVPAAEHLLYGQTYYWAVNACNGSNCSGFASGPIAWASFTLGQQPAATASGAGPVGVVNGDFTGVPSVSGSIPGWTGSGTLTSNADGSSYVANVSSLSSQTLALDYPSAGSASWFRIGYRLHSGGSLSASFATTSVFSSSTTGGAPANTWLEKSFAVSASAGASGVLALSSSGSTADVAYVQRQDASSAQAVPRLGVTGDSEFPLPADAVRGGIDLVGGGYQAAGSDLSLGGIMGLGFARAYNSAGISQSISGGVLAGGRLGPKWSDNWQYRLEELWPGHTIVVWTPGGGAYTFNWDAANSVYTGPQGVNATLDQIDASHFTLTTAHDLDLKFSVLAGMSTGSLTALQDRNGNVTTLSYDAGNRLHTITDPGSRSLTLAYDGSNRISSVSDSASRSVSYSYDAGTGDLITVTNLLGGQSQFQYGKHWLTQATDPNANLAVRNSYNQQGRVTGQQDAAGGQITVAYASPAAGVTTLTDQRAHSSQYYFDAALRVTDTVDAYGKHWSRSYGQDNVVTRSIDPLNETTLTGYDSNDNPVTVTDPFNYVWSMTWDSQNNLLTATDPLNHSTTNSYDANGNLHTVTDALNHTTTITVNGIGQVTAVQNPNLHSTGYGYNTAGDVTSVSDALGHSWTIGRDSVGRATSATDPLTHASSASYNAAGETLTRTDALGDTASSSYDSAGRLSSSQDPNLHSTSYGYTSRNQLSAVTDPVNGGSHQTASGYDAAGDRSSVTDAVGQQSTYTFDNDNRPLTVTDARGTVLTNSYDDAGRLASQTDAKGQVTTLHHNARGQVDSITYQGGMSVTYQYDAAGRRTQMSDSIGTTTYSYDNANRLTSVTSPGAKTVSYGYDAAGNRTSITYPGSHTVSYSYDVDERLSTITDWNSHQFSYSYDNASRMTGVTLPTGTGISTTLAYDNANRLTGLTHSKGGVTVAGASYTLDANGNRSSKLATQNGSTVQNESYAYDALNRLNSVTPSGGSAFAYGLDGVGNRTSTGGTGSGSTSYSYGNADQLSSYTPYGQSAVNYSYDANGSVTGRGSDSFSWDSANRLTSETVGGTTTSMTYFGNGLRASRTSGGVTTSYLWDVQTSTLLDDGTYQYIYGLGAGPLERVALSGGATHYFLSDGLGSTLAIVDSSGSVVQSYTYDVYGKATASSGAFGNEFQFAGQQTDPSGLQYLRARYYDPGTGRFLSRDTAGGHPYSYAASNPATAVDPSGHSPTLDFIDSSGIPQRAFDSHRVFHPDGSWTLEADTEAGLCDADFYCAGYPEDSGKVNINFGDKAAFSRQGVAAWQVADAVEARRHDIGIDGLRYIYVTEGQPGNCGPSDQGCSQDNSVYISVDNSACISCVTSHELGHLAFDPIARADVNKTNMDAPHCTGDPQLVCYPPGYTVPTPGQYPPGT